MLVVLGKFTVMMLGSNLQFLLLFQCNLIVWHDKSCAFIFAHNLAALVAKKISLLDIKSFKTS